MLGIAIKTSFILFIVTNCAKMASCIFIKQSLRLDCMEHANTGFASIFLAIPRFIQHTRFYYIDDDYYVYVRVRVCLRSIFGSVRTQFIWNNLCQRNLIRPMNTWTIFLLVNSTLEFSVVHVVLWIFICMCEWDCVSACVVCIRATRQFFFCSFHFWQTIKSMKICLIWW